jgi:hypothetical protein
MLGVSPAQLRRVDQFILHSQQHAARRVRKPVADEPEGRRLPA